MLSATDRRTDNRIMLNLRVPAEDGVLLATDVYLPAGQPEAIVVMRTPYGKNVHRDEGFGWTRLGFGFVVQDVRGRYDSGGEWIPYHSERSDGSALVSWISVQPWSCPLFVAGASYSAYSGWATAISQPDTVAGVISLVPAMGLRPVKFDPSGILRLAEHASWWIEHGDAKVSRTGLAAALFADSPNLLSCLPVVDIGQRMWASVPGFDRVFSEGLDPERVTDAELMGLPMPSLHIGGWQDLLVRETLHQWKISKHGDLVIGPWGHSLVATGRLQASWIRSVLAGERLSSEDLAGSLRMSTDLLTFGFPGSTSTMAWEIPVGCFYPYEQNNPFPSRDRSADRRVLDERTDVVRIPIEFPETATISGEPVVSLRAWSDAPSVDWIVHLVERFQDGRVLSIADGAAVDDPSSIVLSPLRHRPSEGSRLSIEVTSSDFPRLARNLGTGEDRYTTTHVRPSRQYVESVRIELPVEVAA